MTKHGRPDYYDVSPLVQVHASDDLNELVARQNHVNVYDRRGNVQHVVTFAEGTGDVSIGASGSASYTLSCASSRTDGIALMASLTADANDVVAVTTSQGLVSAETRGGEISFATSTAVGMVQIRIRRWIDTQVMHGQLRIDLANEVLQIEKPDTSWQTVASDVKIAPGENYWHFLKLAVDWENAIYLRGMIDQWVVSLTQYPLYTETSTSQYYDSFTAELWGGAAGSSEKYVDTMIVTVNEV